MTHGDISALLRYAGAGTLVALAMLACFRGRICEGFRVEKKSLRRLHAAAEKLKAIPHLDEAERLLFASSLLATPDERWLRNRRYIQLVNSSKLCAPRKSAS